MNPRSLDQSSQTHFVHAAMRFLRTLRYRKLDVFGCLLVASMLGTLYYVTAPRRFLASTSLMVLYQGNDDSLSGTESYRQGMLPTYERLFYSSEVLDRALVRLNKLPEEALIDFEQVPRDKWVETLRNNLSVRAIRSTNFIEVNYYSANPQAAVVVINKIVEAYLAFIEENQRNVALDVVRTLGHERRDVADRLAEKEKELLRVKEQIGDLGLRDRSRVTHPLVHNVVQINEALAATRQKRTRLEATLAAVRQAVANRQDLRHFMLSMEDSGGRDTVLSMMGMSVRDDEYVQRIERELNDEIAKWKTARRFYGDAHPSLLEMQDSIERKQALLDDYRESKWQRLTRLQNQKLAAVLQATIEGELATATAHEQALQREFDAAQSKAVELNRKAAQIAIIQHDLTMLRQLHDALRNRIANLDIKQNQAEVRIAEVSKAKPDDSPVSPRLLSVCGLCLVGGLAVGSGVAYIRDVLDDRFRSTEELRDQLGVNVLALVRQLPVFDAKGLDSVQVYVSPNGVESESFRTLRSTLAFSDRACESVAISSSEPGDGKTTVLSNLGVASAQAGKRTLLIDADMRRPGLTRLFHLRGQGGLSDVLRSDESVDVACRQRVQHTQLEGLDLLPAGPLPTDPGALLSIPRFSELVSWACGQYDQVLIDTPPVLAASDACIVGRLTGGIVLVVQPSKNHRRLVHRAVDEIRTANQDVVGVVVNRISDARESGYGYSYGYGQGYGHGYQVELTNADLDYQSADQPIGLSASTERYAA